MAMLRTQGRDIGILGYAESVYEKKTTRTLISMLAEVARGRSCVGRPSRAKTSTAHRSVLVHVCRPDNAVTLAEQLGIPISWAYLGTGGAEPGR